jgi:hypothetical protein
MEIDVKRFYFPGVLKDNCPKCGQRCEMDGSEHYLMYPTANEVGSTYLCCPGTDEDYCGHEFEVHYILNVTFEQVYPSDDGN